MKTDYVIIQRLSDEFIIKKIVPHTETTGFWMWKKSIISNKLYPVDEYGSAIFMREFQTPMMPLDSLEKCKQKIKEFKDYPKMHYLREEL